MILTSRTYICLMGKREYGKLVDNYLVRIKEHGMYFRKDNKIALKSFVDKRKYISGIESFRYHIHF